MATVIITLILIAIVASIVLKMIKNKKAGKFSCGCGCENCAMNAQCHKKYGA